MPPTEFNAVWGCQRKRQLFPKLKYSKNAIITPNYEPFLGRDKRIDNRGKNAFSE